MGHKQSSNRSIMVVTELKYSNNLNSSEFDAIVIVAPNVDDLPLPEDNLKENLKAHVAIDASGEKEVFIVPTSLAPKRIVFSGTGALDKDYDDVRSYENAAHAGIKKALKSGSKAPLLYVKDSRFPNAQLVAILGALKALYVPLEMREDVPDKKAKAKHLGVFGVPQNHLDLAYALEAGRIVSRDIGGSDPERMAAARVEEYIYETFDKTDIKIEVMKGQAMFEKEYPCLAAVNRCASVVPRHDGRVIWLSYEPEGGPVEKTVMLVGKGITYDTGGADIKAGGVMAGMSRDKCGAADVAGFLKVVSLLKPANIKVIAAMAMVRNSVGSNSYVSDEIITSRAGVRIRVGNTDAQGRMAMVDVLAHMKEKALNETNPHLMTIATLTGHAVIAVGPYTAVMDNGPAKKGNFAQALQATGDVYGDPFEISTMRKEDHDFIKDKSGEFVDILQCNNAASTRTPRGHQFPGAFLQAVSGLTKHQSTSEKPLKYSHLDVAGSSGGLPDPTTGSSVVALAMHFLQ